MGSVVGAGTWVEKDTAATTIQLPLPAGCAVGDIVIAGWTINSATMAGNQSGFTTLDEIASTGDTLSPSAWVGRRTLSAGDITNGYVTLGSIPAAVASGGVVVVRGFTTTSDFTPVALDKTATSGSWPFGTIVTTLAGVIAVYVAAQNTVQSGTFTPPSGYTESGDRGATGRNATMGYQLYAGINNGAVTLTSTATTKGVALLVALRPTVSPAGSTKFMPFLQ